MNSVISKIIASVFMVASVSVMASSYQEGRDYIDLGDKGFEAENSVVKIYSTNCPFCYKYEKAVMPTFIENLPEGTEYDAYHITTKPPFGFEKASVIAVVRSMDESQYKATKMAYYTRFHVQKKKFHSNDEAIDYGMKAAGFTRADYDARINTQDIQNTLAKWDQGVEIAKMKGVPAIVVNGQYLIVTGSLRSMKMLDDMTAELLAK